MEINMEHYHCGYCGKYVDQHEGYYGAATPKGGGPQRIYCGFECCDKLEPELHENDIKM